MNARLPPLVYELERARERLCANKNDIHSVTNALIHEVLRHVDLQQAAPQERLIEDASCLWVTELLAELSEVCLTLCVRRDDPGATQSLIEAIDSARRKRLWLRPATSQNTPPLGVNNASTGMHRAIAEFTESPGFVGACDFECSAHTQL